MWVFSTTMEVARIMRFESVETNIPALNKLSAQELDDFAQSLLGDYIDDFHAKNPDFGLEKPYASLRERDMARRAKERSSR